MGKNSDFPVSLLRGGGRSLNHEEEHFLPMYPAWGQPQPRGAASLRVSGSQGPESTLPELGGVGVVLDAKLGASPPVLCLQPWLCSFPLSFQTRKSARSFGFLSE